MKRHPYHLLAIACIAVILYFCQGETSPAQALEIGKDSSQPIEITADSLEVVQPDRQATFQGNVLVVQGNLRLKASQMQVHYREKAERSEGMASVSKIEATGSVIMTTLQETAQGDKGIYNVDQKKIRLLGNVILTRGQNALKGDRLEYSLASGKSLIASEKKTIPGGRVKAIFVPEKKK